MSEATPLSGAHRRIFSLLGETVTILGPLGVLGLWLFQQTAVEQRANELRSLSSAHAVFQTYQSHNALFNAVGQTIGSNEAASAEIRRFQMYNYELGLAALDAVLTPAEKAGVPEPVNVYSGNDINELMPVVQKRLELLQTRLAAKEVSIKTAADVANTRYFWIFLGLSLISIFGSLCKYMDGLSLARRPAPAQASS